MKFERSAGLLLHPSSLPSPYGIGDLGPSSREFLDFLELSKQKVWQILPLNPTDDSGCPYNSYGAFAGNHFLISPDILIEDGLLKKEDILAHNFSEREVEFKKVFEFKLKILKIAYQRFLDNPKANIHLEYTNFCTFESDWLDDYALFCVLKTKHNQKPWYRWPEEYRNREHYALIDVRKENEYEYEFQKFLQFIFHRQWWALRLEAGRREIEIMGDIPIYVAYDSVDVWVNKRVFNLDEDCNPVTVSGVPPDYFSETGQLWGNPTFNWKFLKKTDYAWWIERIRHNLRLFDIIRIDHFRAFAKYWAVPFGDKTAENGTWEKSKGKSLFKRLAKEIHYLPIVVEDLGEITEDVVKLRDMFNFPGMKILQFAFDSDEENNFLPHNYAINSVAYTGTHDNDTLKGWYQSASEKDKEHARLYMNAREESLVWDFIRTTWASTSVLAFTTPQDLLELDAKHRMNIPGTVDGNWKWRLKPGELSVPIGERLRFLTELYCRA